MPNQFLAYFKYCDKLKFEQRPDYEFLIAQFEHLFKELGYTHDDEFDWVVQKKNLIEKRALKEAEAKRLAAEREAEAKRLAADKEADSIRLAALNKKKMIKEE